MTLTKGKSRSGAKGKRWSAAYGLGVVEEWTGSGLGAAEFCRARGIALQRLRYWAQRSKQATPASVEAADAAAFFALSVGEAPAGRDGVATAERSDGIEVRIGERVVVSLDPAVGRERFVESVRWILEAVGA